MTRVLVVEDEPLVREMICEHLEDDGLEVVGCHTAEEALERDEPFDVLFTDIRMPGLDGWQLAERMREQRPDIGVIYATGYVGADARPVARSVLIAKPYPPRRISEAIRLLAA